MVELIKGALASCRNKAQVSFAPPLAPPPNTKLEGKKRRAKEWSLYAPCSLLHMYHPSMGIFTLNSKSTTIVGPLPLIIVFITCATTMTTLVVTQVLLLPLSCPLALGFRPNFSIIVILLFIVITCATIRSRDPSPCLTLFIEE